MTEIDMAGHSGGVASASLPATQQVERAEPRAIDFAKLYQLTFPSVWRVLARLGVPPGELADAAQSVYLVVHRRREEFAARSSPKTWVIGIAVRVAADVRRASRRKPIEPLDDELPDPARTPLELASQAEALALVGRLLETLPAERREVFLLAEFEEFTAPEIAESLDLNVNTVYSRLRLARRDFQAALDEFQASKVTRE